MGKETVRYPDALVARVEEFVAEAEAFESKSEFHRFASDFLLTLVDPEHDPTVLGYDDIQADLETASGVSLEPDDVATADGDTPFLQAYLTVRRHLLHGELDEARAYVSETYDIADREALLLDEVIGRHRHQEHSARGPHPSRPSRPSQERPHSQPQPQPQSRSNDARERQSADRRPSTDTDRDPVEERNSIETDGEGKRSSDDSGEYSPERTH